MRRVAAVQGMIYHWENTMRKNKEEHVADAILVHSTYSMLT